LSAEQVTLDAYREDLARRSRDHGAGIALWSSDEWAKAAQLVVDELIATGQPFTSEDVRLVVGPPPSNGAFGALFLRPPRLAESRPWATNAHGVPPVIPGSSGSGWG
jgi:hypothetical protein